MKPYFLTLAALCSLICIGCGGESKTKMPSDPTEAFPDPNFRAYVLENFDTNGDGKISEEEALEVTEIGVYSKKIKSLEGIQYFTNLTDLYCSFNQLTALDVSRNTQLTYLSCEDNQLTALDVSKNTKLEVLRSYSNKLTTLDVSKNTKLIRLSCEDNQLRALDVSKNTKLTELYCWENQIAELDLSKTNLGNEGILFCAPMSTLKKVYLKKGWSIRYITEDWYRSSNCIPDHTEIIFVD